MHLTTDSERGEAGGGVGRQMLENKNREKLGTDYQTLVEIPEGSFASRQPCVSISLSQTNPATRAHFRVTGMRSKRSNVYGSTVSWVGRRPTRLTFPNFTVSEFTAAVCPPLWVVRPAWVRGCVLAHCFVQC